MLIYLDLDVPYGADDWFEWAVECAAYLVYELSSRETKVRLKTQGYDMTAPDLTDVYNILKYLALVAPMRGKASTVPDDTNDYQVVFTTNPSRLAELGWCGGAQGRMLSFADRSRLAGDGAAESSGGPR